VWQSIWITAQIRDFQRAEDSGSIDDTPSGWLERLRRIFPDSAERRRFLNAVYQADDGDYGSDDEFIDLFDPDIH
jgi:hypothetical protein